MSNHGLLQAFLHGRGELLRFLRLRGATPEEAEDILQTVALRLVTQEDLTGAPIEQPRAYLYRMVTNQFMASRRGDARQRSRDEAWVDTRSGPDREADPHPSIETALIARQHLAMLQHVIDGWPERTRAIFRLFRLERLSQKAIAQDQGISLSAVEKHLARAYLDILRIRKEFDEDNPAPRHLSHEQGQAS